MTLAPAVYWRLRYLQAKAEAADAVTVARWAELREALLRAGVAPDTPYQWDDATTSLVPPPQPGGDA